MFNSFLLILLLSIDSFMVSIAYSIKNIKISFKYIILIALVNVLSIYISMCFGYYISLFLPLNILKYISSFILILLGIYNIFQDKFKTIYKNSKSKILMVYYDETSADFDNSNTLGFRESLFLSIVLSLDSLLGGVSIGYLNFNFLVLIIFMFILNIILLFLGVKLGNKLNKILNINSGFLTGIIIILIALSNLFF